MRIKPPALEIPQEDPFRFDLLARRPSAEALTSLISQAQDGLVLCLNAPWGSGKSTFVQMWRALLEERGFKSLLFNAWESDYVDDPMIALLGELELGIDELKSGDEPAEGSDIRRGMKRLKRIGGSMLKKVVPVGVKLATGGLVDIEEWDDEVGGVIGDELAKVAEEQIQAYEQAKGSIGSFKETLQKLAHEIGGVREDGTQRPLVLFIDELDRCRPPFAIRVLELVKHFFAVPGIVFVLSLDREQLGHSVRTQYGADMDVAGYLRRFFDIEFQLPLGTLRQFTAAQVARFELNQMFKDRERRQRDDEWSYINRLFVPLFEAMGCALRDVERCMSQIALVLMVTPPEAKIHPIALAPLVVVRVKMPELYRDLVSGKQDGRAIVALLEKSEAGRALLRERLGRVLHLHLRAMTIRPEHQDKLIQEMEGEFALFPNNSSKREAHDQIIQWLKSGQLGACYDSISYLDAKLNLVSNLQRY